MALSKQEIDELLSKEEVCFTATVKKGGSPHIAPIWFLYVDGKIYFETDTTTVKYKNIQRKNAVAICFGGKDTLIIEGSVKDYGTEENAPIPFRKLFREKYKEAYDDSYINEKTHIFEVIPKKQMTWHYEIGEKYFPD